MSELGPAPTAAPPVLPAWRRALPFLVAALLLTFVLYRIDFHAFWEAVSRTHYVLFFAFTLVFNAALLGADALATAQVYNALVCPVRYAELFVIRGASYLPSLLNHHVGQAWLTYFMAKVYKASLWRVAGATLLVYATTFGCVYLIGAAALPFHHGSVPWLVPVTLAIGVSGLAYLVVIATKPAFLRSRQTTAALLESGLRGHLLALAYRLPHVVVLFFGTWVPFLFFGIDVPFTDALAFIPVVMLVTALPITPQGIGTREFVALQLLAGYAPGNPQAQAGTVAATTLSWAVSLTLVQVVFAPVFMRQAQRLLARANRAT